MFRLELKEKKKIFWIFTIIFVVLQLIIILGRPWITRVTTQQMQLLTQGDKVSHIPPQMLQVIENIIYNGDNAYFAGQWMVQNFIVILIFVVLILGAGTFMKQRMDKSYNFSLNFVSRERYLSHKMGSSFLVITGWLLISCVLSLILVLSLGWDVHPLPLIGSYVVSGLRMFVIFQLMVLISLFFKVSRHIYLLAVLIGLVLTTVIQILSPFGKLYWLAGSNILFDPRKLLFEMIAIIPLNLVFYFLIKRKWLKMEI